MARSLVDERRTTRLLDAGLFVLLGGLELLDGIAHWTLRVHASAAGLTAVELVTGLLAVTAAVGLYGRRPWAANVAVAWWLGVAVRVAYGLSLGEAWSGRMAALPVWARWGVSWGLWLLLGAIVVRPVWRRYRTPVTS